MINLPFAICLLAAGVTPPRIPATKPAPRWERLLRTEVEYLLNNTPPAPIPNELEHAIRPLTATAFSAAACSKFAACDQRAVNLSRRLIAEVTRVHLTGGGVTANGKAWGHHWQSALWTWQAAMGAWLIWDDMDADLRGRIVAMVADEADRFVDLPAPYARFYDTKAEENAWNALLLVFAGEVLDGHPHQARWRARSHEYIASAFATSRERGKGSALGGLISATEEPQWVYGTGKRSIAHDGSTWLNFDNRFGYAISGGGGIREIPDVRSVLLALNQNPRSNAVIVSLPGADQAETRRFAASDFRLDSGHPDAVVVEVDGFLIVANFSAHPLKITCGGHEPVSIYGYSTRVVRPDSEKPAGS